ncbi:hypothetical protein SAMN06295905_1976 [Devosia lucknowensis]|uniref:Uncharacterized protein n=2 Tax=Devosia lucknowensis TaxID=1096929 RepID=A0A1Y6FGG6_9HYPH|nr:hypothetical protein SAMN06295905_1976 [Devosia lucknowensis]
MPKNQFQRPAPIQHTGNVPRHGKPQPPQAKSAEKRLSKLSTNTLPPLETLLAKSPQN